MAIQFDLNAEVKSVDVQEVARKVAPEAFTQLRFLDDAELALIGGGGAHGGNTL